jgi:hypothetical protein
LKPADRERRASSEPLHCDATNLLQVVVKITPFYPQRREGKFS